MQEAQSSVGGATENARSENAGRSKMQEWKMRDLKMRDQNARGKMRDHQVWKAIWRLSVQTVS